MGVIRLVAPGPLVPNAKDGISETLVAPSAANPEACSCRLFIIGVTPNRAIASIIKVIIPPDN